MKRLNQILNVVMGAFIGVFIGQSIYKIWHYNNKARVCSLKDLEIAMKMPNVEEMPIHHTTWCKKGDEEIILEY